MVASNALCEFQQSLLIAEELLEIDKRNYHNPPRLDQQKAVQGLRGGAAVLMVAAFEAFLRQAMEEYLASLTIQPLKVPFDKLPEKMRINSVFATLEQAMKGPPFQEPLPKHQRLIDIETACKLVLSGTVNPVAFINTGSNPNSKSVKLMFSNLGVKDIFGCIKDRFESKWGKPVAQTFIADKLDEVVNRRHIVAHTANALSISRSDLKESIKFLKVLATLLDTEIKNHIREIVKLSV